MLFPIGNQRKGADITPIQYPQIGKKTTVFLSRKQFSEENSCDFRYGSVLARFPGYFGTGQSQAGAKSLG